MNRTRFQTIALVLGLAAATAIGGYAYVNNAEAQDAKAANTTSPAAGKASKPLKDVIKPDAVYATVNDEKITGKEVQAFIAKLPPQLQGAPADKLLEMIVNQMVNDKLVAQAAASEKLTEEPETKKRLVEAQEQVIRERYVEKVLEGKITDSALKAKYNEMVKTMPAQDEVRARHILVADEKTAEDIIAKLNKGEDFAKLAKQYSTDPTKENGGDLGYFVRPAMVKEFGDAAFAMKKGETTKNPVKTQFGWHVIRIEDSRAHKAPEFDQVKDRVKAQITDENVRKMIDELRIKNKVNITLPQS